MKIPKRIIHKIPRIIKDVSGVYAKALPPTQRHLLPELLFALLRNPSVYISDVARKMEGCSTSIGAKEMKVLRLLHHPKVSFNFNQLLEAHLEHLSTLIQRHRHNKKNNNKKPTLRIYADMSEVVKPWAKKMDAIDRVRDASASEAEKNKNTLPGYWLNEVYLSPKEGRMFPVVLYPFPLPKRALEARPR